MEFGDKATRNTDSIWTRPVEILLVEDNPGDARLTQEALNEGAVPNRLHLARDGEQALAFLRREEPFGESPRPDLILLDLNLPKTDGREVLGAIKSDQQFRQIPIIVLTSSTAEEDVEISYDLHANCYLPKPIEFDHFAKAVRAFSCFWLSFALLPPVRYS